jgi:hypothetical protein
MTVSQKRLDTIAKRDRKTILLMMFDGIIRKVCDAVYVNYDDYVPAYVLRWLSLYPNGHVKIINGKIERVVRKL